MQIRGYENEDEKCIECNSNEPTKEIRFNGKSIFLCEKCREILKDLLKLQFDENIN